MVNNGGGRGPADGREDRAAPGRGGYAGRGYGNYHHGGPSGGQGKATFSTEIMAFRRISTKVITSNGTTGSMLTMVLVLVILMLVLVSATMGALETMEVDTGADRKRVV